MRLSFLRALGCLLPFATANCSSDMRGETAPSSGGAVIAGAPRGAGTGGMASATNGGNGGSSAASSGRGGATAMAGSGGSGGSPGAGTGGSSAGTGGSSAGAGGSSSMPAELARFSFFVTSLEAMQRLSMSQNGFGGDLRYGEADGLSGADKICTEIAEASMAGASAKGWRAFLSVNQGASGQPVHAIDRVGDGPWYDRLGRILAMKRDDLLNARPAGAHAEIRDDLPNEFGVPNRMPDPGNDEELDNHHMLTGTNDAGHVYGPTGTCDDWSSTARDAGRPRVGYSWPAAGREHWISGQDEGGCGAGVLLQEMGGSNPNNPIVGSGGGYGGIYCFALMP